MTKPKPIYDIEDAFDIDLDEFNAMILYDIDLDKVAKMIIEMLEAS